MEVKPSQLAAGLVLVPAFVAVVSYVGGVFDWARKPNENSAKIEAIQRTLCDEGVWSKDLCKTQIAGWEPPAREYRVYSAKANTESGAVRAAQEADRKLHK